MNGYQVTPTVEEATGYAVYGALHVAAAPLALGARRHAASTSPPGVYLTDSELASNLSFFLTDQPPDDMLVDAARPERCGRTSPRTSTASSRRRRRATG